MMQSKVQRQSYLIMLGSRGRFKLCDDAHL